MATIDELSDEFPFQLDWNSGEHLGVGKLPNIWKCGGILNWNYLGWVQSLIKSGVRSSARDYLSPEVLERDNLDILLHAQVSRVLETTNGTLDFRTLEFRDYTTGMSNSLSEGLWF